MKKLTITDRQLFIAGLISIALIATGSMVGTWIGITGMVAVSIMLMFDPFEATELQGQLTEPDPFVVSCFEKAEADRIDRLAKRAQLIDEQTAARQAVLVERGVIYAAGRDAEVERGDRCA